MEFLYRLYSNDYFGIGLFIVIAVLAFSFLVILFFGKKDEKMRNEQMKDEIESDTLENKEEKEVNDTPLETITLPVEKSEEKEIEPELNPFSLNNVVLNSNLVEPNSDNVIVNEDEHKEEFDLASVADSLNKELTEEESNTSTDEASSEFNPFTSSVPIIEEERENDIFTDKVDNEPIKVDVEKEKSVEKPKKVVMPNQFSSVYLSKETPVKENEQVVEEIAPIPLKPEFDLPKTLDLPKLNKASNSDENIIKPILNEENNLNNIFNNIEEDTYTIKK